MARKDPLKSVHITNYYHKNSGGISTAYDKLLEAANRRRRFVRLIVPGESDAVEEVGEYGRIYYVEATKSPIFDKRYRIMLPWKTYIFDQSPIKKILREEMPDIIEIGEKYTLSLMAGLLRKGVLNVAAERPVLVHFSCERMDDNVRAFISDGRVSRWFSRRYIGSYILPMFDFHIANSNYTADELFESVRDGGRSRAGASFLDLCWRFFRASQLPVADRVFVNQCGADTQFFSRDRRSDDKRRRLADEAGFPSSGRWVLYAGRLSPEKNIRLLPGILRALSAQRGDYRLLIAGDGPQAEWLRRELDESSPGKAKLLGHIADKEKLADIYANSDVFVHPNPREPFGIGPLEAMASGLPVVAPRSGGVLSYATDENAWLVDHVAPESFAAAIVLAAGQGPDKQKKVEAAAATSGRYSWEDSTDRLFELYDRMREDFSDRRADYMNVGGRPGLAFRALDDLNKYSPASVLFTIRCCDTRSQAMLCILYFLLIFASAGYCWGRRKLIAASWLPGAKAVEPVVG